MNKYLLILAGTAVLFGCGQENLKQQDGTIMIRDTVDLKFLKILKNKIHLRA